MNPILVALDLASLEEAESLARRLEPHVGGFKVGLELIMAEGPEAVSRIAAIGPPVFADVKLHDIPNTVHRAAQQVSRRGARWMTIHGAGGRAMIEAAVEGAGAGSGVLVVTVLTSLDDEDLEAVGVMRGVPDQVSAIARLAGVGGAEGVICSPFEASVVKAQGAGLIAVTPGVRVQGGDAGDQKRFATPREAVELGADYLVVGRSITGADDPVAAAARMAASLE